MLTSRSTDTAATRWVRGIVLAVLAVAVAVGVYRWSAKRTDYQMAVALTRGDPDRAPALLRRYGCSGCHTISALRGADGKVAPSLDNLRQRVYIAGKLPNTPDNLVHWIVAPQSFAPAAAMPDTGINESEARDVAAFLYTN